MIYATVNMTVGDYSSKCDTNIVLYRGDRNVEIRFVIKGNRFTVLDSTYAQMIIRRPSATSVFSDPAPIQNDTVVFTISEDMIDELKEIGAYTFQVRLYDNSMNARATLPPCEGCLIINQPIATEGEALVNAAMINDSAVLAAAVSDIPEDEIFTEDNAYNRTVWMDGDIITDVRMNKIENALYYINEKGGGGTATAPYISTSLPETVMVGSGEDFELDLDFSSPNLGKGTLKVFINDVDSMNQKIDQGMSITTIPGSLFSKGTNMVVIYVLDRVGMMSNSLTFYVRYGGTEVTSTFDAYTSYDYGATVRYYFTPTALDTSLQLTFYMEIDGVTQSGVPCISDVRSYYTFPTNLSVGNHYCRAWVTDGTTRSNVLTFNLIILDATSLVVATDTLNPTVEEGTQLVLDYKVYMKNNTSFITKTYVDNNLINTGTCTLETAYYRTTNLTAGTHTIKVEVFDVTETYTDFVTWTVTVTESTYTMLEPAKAGSIFMATAYNKSNVDENREVWIGSNQDNDDITASLSNFSFNSENGWIDDALVISGNSWVEIPVQPLANNAQYGFTLDIEFKTKAIGVEDAEVLTLWNETDNCGIKITTEQLIMRSKTGNQCDLYFPEDEIVSAIFVIDRDEKTAKIYLNGVMCEAFALSDYEAAGQKYLEDFTVNSNVYLGGYNKNGYCAIKNIRIYEVALATNEILNNFMSNEKDKAAQRELVEFQKGNTLPTLTVYCDFSGLGKDDKKPCNIVYNSPDVNLYGESFTLDGKHSMLQYQGTSSMQYPIKNYRLNPRDENGKVKLDPFNNGVGESRFTLKADFMSSGHWQNTGMAKFVNDCLYNYNPNDEKSMNPAKWWSLQNGGSLKDTRETINGFPCRLILVNDGETALNEGQQEPTPGNTKDMGIFNFNNDKDNVNTLGLDTEIFPNCISYEVTANSDTSAGAFVPFGDGSKIPFYFDETDSKYVSSYLNIEFIRNNFLNPGVGSAWFSYDSSDLTIKYYNSSFAKHNYDMTLNNGGDTYNNHMYKDGVVYAKLFASTLPSYIQGYKDSGGIKYETKLSNDTVADIVWEYSENDTSELEYLQNSFELRYPDEDDVGSDYGYLGMAMNAYFMQTAIFGGARRTPRYSPSFFGSDTITIEESDFKNGIYNIYVDGKSHSSQSLPMTVDVSGAEWVYFQPYGNTNWTYLKINGVDYFVGEESFDHYDTTIFEPYIGKKVSSEHGLKRLIDWVGNCTDEEFVADFEKYFNKQYVLRYYLLVIVCGMVDNLGKNMMLDTWDGQIWYPRFYDMDTICSYDNSGEIKFDVDIEMAQGYWNTSSSRLWTKVRDLFHDELVETYNNMRQNNFSYEKFMSYFYDKQIAQIPQTYYNKDYDVKYAPYANEYMGKAHGDGYEHLKRWLKRRLIFTDTLFDYAPSYTNDALTIRANTLDLMSLEIETYTPVYQHVSFYNGNMEKIKIDGKTATTFTGTAQTATDQEVLIYGGSNIKSIKGIQSMNPNSMLIGNATKLTQLDISNCPILTVVNSNKANFSPHTYLNKLDISNCPQLGGQLNISNSPLLQELNALGSTVDNILFPTSVRNLETLRVPKTVTSLNLTDAGLLYTIEMEEGNNLQNISLTNCNNLTETINFDLTQTPTVLLDNSFNGEEIYMSATTNLTLKNMPSLKRVIFTPNSEYSAFDINNVLNGASYKITTFNNPMMTDFITTAPYRLSYKNDSAILDEQEYTIPVDQLEGVKQLESVYFDSTAYVDLGFIPTSSMKIELDVKMEFNKQYGHWVGSDEKNKIQWGSGTTNLQSNSWAITPTSNLTTRQTYTISCITSGNVNLYLFCGYSKDNVETNYCGKGTLYNCKIYDEEKLIHNYIPCDELGVACLYDAIEKEIVYAEGTLIGGERIIIKKYGDITPNTAFTANTLDLADTQFTNVKFLCTTDVYNLKVPTTMKNFYCDSAFDIDTDVIEDASYEVIHEELIEPYTTNYEGEVSLVSSETITESITSSDERWTTGVVIQNINNGEISLATNCATTDYIKISENIEVTATISVNGTYIGVIFYDENKNIIGGIGTHQNSKGSYSGTSPQGTKYMKISITDKQYEVTLTYYGIYTPNIIPSSANGSLIFNMYSNNTTQPTSTSPYMWDLTGLKLEDFYTFGMNNNVKPSEESVKRIANIPFIYGATPNSTAGNPAIFRVDAYQCMFVLRVEPGEVYSFTRINDTDGTAPYYGFGDSYYDSSWNTVYVNAGYSAWGSGSVTVPEGAVYAIFTPKYVMDYNKPYINKKHYIPIGDGSYLYVTPTEDCAYSYTTANFSNSVVLDAVKSIVSTPTGGNSVLVTSPASITMPQRMPGYSVRLVNADITPDEYPTMLYPKLIDTTLPITGKLDYTKYNGTSLAWAYAYTTGDVSISPLDSRNQGNITQDYNKLYGTDFVDIVDVWVYKDTDTSKLSTNEAITKAYIELTNDNYKTRIDEVLKWYPNCTDLYLFEDGSVTSLLHMTNGNNVKHRSQITKVIFLDGYFDNVTTMGNCFQECTSLTTVPTIPNGVTNMQSTFYGCKALTQAPTIPQGVTNMQNTFYGCTSLTTAPTIPSSVTSMQSTFQNCTALTTAPTIPQGVTNMANTFRGCPSLTTPPTIPNSVTIMDSCFWGCATLTTAPTIPTSVADMRNCFRESGLIHAPILTKPTIQIAYAYYNCKSLKSAYIPLQGQYANGYTDSVGGCTALETITFVGEWSRTEQWDKIVHGSIPSTTFQTALHDFFANHLATVESATLTLGDYISHLSEEEIAQAVAKGWTLE